MGRDVTPPRLTASLLETTLGDGVVGLSILGDLREEFGRRAERDGHVRAGWWYRREASGVFVRALLRRASGRREWDRREQSASLEDGMGGGAAKQRSIRELGAPMGPLWFGMIENRWRDFRHALRHLRRYPGFATAAVLTLALGLGGTAALGTVVYQVLLRPLPYTDSDRMYEVVTDTRNPETGQGRGWSAFTPQQYRYVKSQTSVDLTAWVPGYTSLFLDGERPEPLQDARVDIGFFRFLGVAPALGRTFTSDDLSPDGVPLSIILTHDTWVRDFGADSSLVGRNISVKQGSPYFQGTSRTVVGILPEGFEWYVVGVARDPGSWSPYFMSPTHVADIVVGLARPARGVQPDVMATELGSALQRFRAETYEERLILPKPAVEHIGLTPLRDAYSASFNGAPMLVLFGSGSLLLLLVIVNIGHLVLGRAVARTREFAVRASLGAGRKHLVPQLATEIATLVGLAAVVAVGIAWLGIPLFAGLAPEEIPYMADARLSLGSVAVIIGLTIFIAGCLVAPLAGWVSRLHLSEGLRSGSAGAGRTKVMTVLQRSLVFGEAALSVLVLVAGGLLIRSFYEMVTVDLGFEAEYVTAAEIRVPSRILTESLDPDSVTYTPWFAVQMPEVLANALETWTKDLMAPLDRDPRISSTAVATRFPLLGRFGGAGQFMLPHWDRDELTDEQRQLGGYGANTVTPGYFETLGMRIVRGREILETDRHGSGDVAVINDYVADRYWPGEDPIGKRFGQDSEFGGGI